jgi:type II secretory pathway pseudopilin PulG
MPHSPPYTPSPPFFPDSLALQPVVVLVLVIQGSVESFDERTFRTRLASQFDGVAPEQVHITLNSASIRVTASIRVSTWVNAGNIAQTMRTASVGALTTALGVNVLTVASVIIDLQPAMDASPLPPMLVPSPPPPSPLRPPSSPLMCPLQTPSAPPRSPTLPTHRPPLQLLDPVTEGQGTRGASSSETSGVTVGIVVGCVLLLLLIAVALLLTRRRQRLQRQQASSNSNTYGNAYSSAVEDANDDGKNLEQHDAAPTPPSNISPFHVSITASAASSPDASSPPALEAAVTTRHVVAEAIASADTGTDTTDVAVDRRWERVRRASETNSLRRASVVSVGAGPSAATLSPHDVQMLRRPVRTPSRNEAAAPPSLDEGAALSPPEERMLALLRSIWDEQASPENDSAPTMQVGAPAAAPREPAHRVAAGGLQGRASAREAAAPADAQPPDTGVSGTYDAERLQRARAEQARLRV